MFQTQRFFISGVKKMTSLKLFMVIICMNVFILLCMCTQYLWFLSKFCCCSVCGFYSFFVVVVILLLFPQFIQSNIAFYIKYSVGLEGQYPYVIAVVLVTAVIWIFFWQFFIIKFGKKTAMTVGMWITLPTLIALLFGNYFKMGAYAVAVILSFGLSCAYLIPW